MSHPFERPAPLVARGTGLTPNGAATHQTPGHSTASATSYKPGTQLDRVVRMLLRGWVCGSEFLEAHLPRYGARIYDLRQDGWYVSKQVCQHPWHRHESTQWQWRIEAKPPSDGQLFGDPT